MAKVKLTIGAVAVEPSKLRSGISRDTYMKSPPVPSSNTDDLIHESSITGAMPDWSVAPKSCE